VWTSSEINNNKLNEAYKQTLKEGGKVYLFYSVHNCGCFLGFAEMMSEIDFSTKLTIWTKNIWMGKFNVQWHYIKDVPDNEFVYLKTD